MILSFTTKWKDGTSTYFPEMIWEGLNKEFHHVLTRSGVDAMITKGYKFDIAGEYKPKLHTIREDKHSRWKAGMNIHFRIFNRTKNTVQFAPVVKCKNVQKITIDWFNSNKVNAQVWPEIKIDGRRLLEFEIRDLARNDGFTNTDDFFKVFSYNFKGKIIHWTDLKY